MKQVVAVLVIIALTSCGFRLQGGADLPAVMERTYISYGGTSASVRRTVARALSLNGVTMANRAETSTAILDILSMQSSRRVLLKDFNGRPRESSVTVSIAFRLRTPDGQVLLPNTRVTRRSSVVLEPTDPLASEGELNSATNSLGDEVVLDMLRLISAAELPEVLPPREDDNVPVSPGGVPL